MVKMGTVWDRTAEFLSDNIAAILPIALLAFFVPASIEGNFEAAKTGASAGMVTTLYVLQVVFAVVQVWGSLVIAAMALDIASDRTASAIGTRRLIPALLVSVAMLVAAMVLVLPIPAVLAASGVDLMALARGENVEIGRSATAFVAIYALLLAGILLWLAARLSVVTPVIVREDRVFGAIAQSWRLTRGVALRIVGVIILYAVVASVAQLAAKTVFGSVFALVAGEDGGGVSLASVFTSIVAAAVQTAFAVLAPAFTAKLYLALTARAGLRQTAAAA